MPKAQKRKKPSIVRTLREARAYVLSVEICGIFSQIQGECLWEATDLPARQPGQKGWGEKVTAVWGWKSELPFRYPEEIFYGKIPGGLAALMSIDYLRTTHYPACHKPIVECSPLAQRLYALLRLDPLTTPQLRQEADMVQKPDRNRFDKALRELQVTLNIVRRHGLADTNDTWVPFREQHLDIAQSVHISGD